MARARADDEPQVRLYVVSTGWPYKPTHCPYRAKVVLYGATSARGEAEEITATGQNVSTGAACVEHSSLAQALLRVEHDCLFIVDVSEIAQPQDWQDEMLRPGRARRMLERWFAKFNCKEATVIAFAQDATLWAPLANLHGEQRISRVVAPTAVPFGAQTELEKAQVETLQVDFQDGWHDVVRAATGEDVSDLPFEDLYFTAVDFDVHRRSKQLVQNAHNISSFIADLAASSLQPPVDVSDMAPAQPVLVPGEVLAMLREAWEVKSLVSSATALTTHCLMPGMTFTALTVKVLSVQSDEEVLRATCADCHASVEVIANASASLVKGANVCISGSTITLEGRLFVLARHVAQSPATLREGYAVVPEGQHDVSRLRRCFGCLVLRGKKCVLARDADKNLRIPLDEAALKETAQQAAVRALAEACDIYPEEFFMLQNVAPAVYYEGSTVVSIFCALATNPPPPGASEDEDLLDEDDLYDWFRYDSAVARLPLQQRRVLARLSADLRDALVAKVVTSDYPCDFGSDVVEAPPEPGAGDVPRSATFRANFGDGFNWRRAKNCQCW